MLHENLSPEDSFLSLLIFCLTFRKASVPQTIFENHFWVHETVLGPFGHLLWEVLGAKIDANIHCSEDLKIVFSL